MLIAQAVWGAHSPRRILACSLRRPVEDISASQLTCKMLCSARRWAPHPERGAQSSPDSARSRPQLNDRLKGSLEGGQRHRYHLTIQWIKDADIAAVEIQDGISVEADDSSRHLQIER